jgi:hypothetical protein
MCVLVCLCALWNLPTSKGNQVLAVGEGREACDMWRWRGRVLKNLKKKKSRLCRAAPAPSYMQPP